MDSCVHLASGRIPAPARWSQAGVLAMLAFWCIPHVQAQFPSRQIPSAEHFTSFNPYMDGDYNSALRLFSSASRIKMPNNVVWIDSIPYHTMVGECKYHMGDLAGALDQYTAALQVYLRYQDWLLRLNVPDTLLVSKRVVRKPPTWGVPARTIRVAAIPDQLGSRQGNSDEANLRALQQGGVIAMQQVVLVNAKEIARCTALAIRRRMEILGPAGEHDGLTNELITALSRRPAPPNNWSQAWIGVQLGLAQACKGKTKEAVSELTNSLLMAGMDHNLTSTALLELGKLAFQAQDYAAAENFCLEATYSAAVLADDDFTQYEIIAEAFRWGMIAHWASGRQEFFQPLAAAADWSRRGPRILESSILVSAAENYAALHDANRAGGLLDRALVVMRGREFQRGDLGARYQFVFAQTAFLKGDGKRGAAALTDAMKYMNQSSLRLFQIVLADRLATSGAITTRQAGLLYGAVLRDPTLQDWNQDPLESLAVLKIPHVVPYEHWLTLVLNRKELDIALRISESLKRHRFYTSLPLGGRLLNLRWTLEAPAESLPPDVLVRRQGLLNRFPAYAELSKQARQLEAELAALPAVAEDQDRRNTQAELRSRLADVGAAQEAFLQPLALGREPCDFVFPPTTDVDVVKQQLAPGQRVLAFVATQQATYAFMLGADNYASWQLEAPAKIRTNVQKLLRDIGHYDRNQPIGVKELTNTAWKDAAAEVLKQLTSNASADAWTPIEELIIVPDGLLWYVPFEILQIDNGKEKFALIDKVRIRYVPTISCAVPDKRPRRRLGQTVVIAGSLFPRAEEDISQEWVAQLKAEDPNVYGVSSKTPPQSPLLTKTIDRLVVLSDLDNDAKGPYDWSPVSLERGKSTGSLGQLMALPWGAPDQIVLPGFHTPAETALKRGGSGEDLFLTTCGMMATGARTILLSRWRDGGRTSYDLVREFVRELPHRTASEAWQRSVRLAMTTSLDLNHEPRVKPPPTEVTLKADHPFFWGGYMLIDTGIEPK